jgi:hypothetical protein
MCDECRNFGAHHSQCPNAPEPKKIFDCKLCTDSIVEGDSYYDLPEIGKAHEACVKDLSSVDLLEKFGEYPQIAESEGEWL